MIKKTITYDDYNDNEVTEDFYFNLNKLEMLELEIKFEGGLDGQIKRISKTQSAQEAYQLFKEIVLASYGEKSEDGKRFIKSEEITRGFEQSPALSELILEFLQDPTTGAAFVEGMLPSKLVAEIQASASNGEQPNLELPVAPEPEKKEEISDEELLAMDPLKMNADQLRRAYTLKMAKAE